MSNIHPLFGQATPAPTPHEPPPPRKRGPYRRKVTKAEIARLVRTAEDLGLTIYGVTLDGDKVHLQTKPGPNAAPTACSAIDSWFDRHG